MKHSAFLLTAFLVVQTAFAGTTPISVTNIAAAGAFPIVANRQATILVVDAADEEVVTIVATAFAGDVNLVTNVQPIVANVISTAKPMIVGTLGRSSFIADLVSAGKLDATKLDGKWETFLISVVDNPLPGVEQALVVAGSDPRGTAFGLFELSRMMGVSPWVWFADVIPEKKNEVYVTTGESIFGPPSVQYRGFFINDEDWAMQPWAARNMDPGIRPNGGGDMGPQTYAKIFELMLRMKSNYLWPAMHACTKAFWFYPANPEMARKYSIVMGSSHCEQMLRDNEDEWRNNFQSEYGHASGDWNWATNSANIKKYWTTRVIQAKNTDAVYTMGMRGIHDSGIPGYNTDEERKTALMDIIANQRTILTTNLEKPINEVPQVFIPYKEVLRIYNLGVTIPDDISLMWADDNFGYMRQLSNPAEQARSGGGGVYYHFSYLGPPNSYLWLASVPVSVAAFELRKAYELNCKKMWIFNVGDIKPQEFELQFAMDLAWDINAVELENPNLYAKKWGAEIFGEQVSEQIYQIKREYFRLAAAGKPECVSTMSFSVAEMEKRIADYNALVELVKNLETQIPDRLNDAYFQLIKYPIEGAAAMNVKHLGAKLSFEYGAQGLNDEALDIAAQSVLAFQKIIDLTRTYNKDIAGGKWDGMMSYSPNGSAYFNDPTVFSTPDNSSVGNALALKSDSIVVIPAENYVAANSAGYSLKKIDGLGITNGITIYPYNMTTYTEQNITSAPSLEYTVPVLKGTNIVSVQCLPTFPLYKGLKLRYAVSIDNAAPVFVDFESDLTGESSALWGQNVMQGYASGTTNYESTTDKTVSVKIYFPDPALVVSAIKVTCSESSPLTGFLVNPSFEDTQGLQVDGANFRGDPYGWTRTGILGGQSWGINKDMSNIAGIYGCWYSAQPMPANFELFQIVRDLPEGEYVVRCRMACMEDKLGTARLFANNNVQYFGSQSDYSSNLVQGENYTFANYTPQSSSGSGVYLQEMAVKVRILMGDSLKLGIRTGNKKKDGSSATDQTGWFKIDHFRLECIKLYADGVAKTSLDSLLDVANNLYNSTKGGIAFNEYPVESRNTFSNAIGVATTVSNNNSATTTDLIDAATALKTAISNYRNSLITATSFIVNPGFEYKRAGELNDGSTFRGTPYGWADTGITGTSFGINNDGLNIAGNNCCWYLSSGPMPAAFELYQIISGLPAGKYTVSCRMGVMDEKYSTQRLFANNNVQYYGKETDYGQNLTAGETASFAGWTSTAARYLKNMLVEVEIAKGDSLKIGVRSGNTKANGQAATDDSGWFKVDDFQIKLKELGDNNETKKNEITPVSFEIKAAIDGFWLYQTDVATGGNVTVYSLTGNQIISKTINANTQFFPLSQGFYLVKMATICGEKVEKIIVR